MNTPKTLPKPCVFVDADVLFAGSASPSEHGASLLVLRLGELTLIDAITSEQVITEAERNLSAKMPDALPLFRLLVNRALTIVPDPSPEEVRAHAGLADPEDLPILVAALKAGCPWLTTFNLRHYRPGHRSVKVLRPGEFIRRVREMLAYMGEEES
jgi:predicted nucleic acid-binding protein